MKKTLLILTACLTIVSANVGKITSFKGDVFVLRDNQKLNVSKNYVLELKDTIKTSNNSKALIHLNDQTTINIGKNSSIIIEEFLYNKNKPKTAKARFNFGNGLYRTITGKIGKINPKKFKINTKSASIGIRGTIFDIAVNDDVTNVAVIDGAVYLINSETSNQYEIQKGESLVFDRENKNYKKKQGTLKESNSLKITNSLKVGNEDINIKTSVFENEDIKEVEFPSFNALLVNDKNEILDETINNVGQVQKETEETTSRTDKTNAISKQTDTFKTIKTPDIPSLDELIEKETESLSNNDKYMDFGFTKDSSDKINGTFVAGNLTPTITLDDYKQNNIHAAYSGTVAAVITDTNNVISTVDNGNINLNFNFGQQTFDGEININEKWNANINSGTIQNSNFNSNDLTSSTISDLTGEINGNFTGPNANSAAGKINLNSITNGKVEASFGASKQGD